MAKEYIEREALPQKRERGFFSEDDFNAGWNACLHEIKKLPVADVRENVKDEWKGDYPQATFRLKRCSVCETLCPEGWYCFFCGAKMDGEDGDNGAV